MNRASDKPLIIPYRAARHFQRGNKFLSFGRASSNSARIILSELSDPIYHAGGEKTRLIRAAGDVNF